MLRPPTQLFLGTRAKCALGTSACGAARTQCLLHVAAPLFCRLAQPLFCPIVPPATEIPGILIPVPEPHGKLASANQSHPFCHLPGARRVAASGCRQLAILSPSSAPPPATPGGPLGPTPHGPPTPVHFCPRAMYIVNPDATASQATQPARAHTHVVAPVGLRGGIAPQPQAPSCPAETKCGCLPPHTCSHMHLSHLAGWAIGTVAFLPVTLCLCMSTGARGAAAGCNIGDKQGRQDCALMPPRGISRSDARHGRQLLRAGRVP